MRTDNRAALLRGARTCLDANGYAQTTARDVAAEAGVSLAAISYHFRTVDALLVETILAGIEEWSRELDRILAAASSSATQMTGRERLATTWNSVTASFTDYRGVLGASFELMARARQDTAVHEKLRTSIDGARRGLAQQLHGVDPTVDPDRAHGVGAVSYALVSGLIVQWLVDPQEIPDGDRFADALLDVVGVDPSTSGRRNGARPRST